MLRKIVDAQEREKWLRTACAAAWFHRTMTGEILDPNEMIPESLKPPKPPAAVRTPEQEKHDTECALMMIGEALKARA